MHMDASLDTGPVIATRTCPIAPNATSEDLYSELASMGADLALEFLSDPEDMLQQAPAQDNSSACVARRITKLETYIDWSQPAVLY